MAAISDSGLELNQHPPYSDNLALPDFSLLPKLKKAISGTNIQSDNGVIQAVEDCLDSQENDFFKSDIEALQHRWRKCIDTEGGVVEK